MKDGLKALYGSKAGKILPVLIIAGLVASASASIFVNYYATGTATARTNDVKLALGPDDYGSSCGTITPCVHSTISPSGDSATMSVNLGLDNSSSPQPQTYFTEALVINNTGTVGRNVTTIITSATETGLFFGSMTVYYCTTNPAHADPATVGGCTGHTFTANIGSPVTIVSGASLASNGGAGFIALVGWANAATSTLTFHLQFMWA